VRDLGFDNPIIPAQEDVSLTPPPEARDESRLGGAGQPALVSKNLAGIGLSVTGPRGPYASRPSKITFSNRSDFAAYVDQLHWFDWGKPVAYARGIVHTRAWQQHGYVATPGGVIIDQLQSCNGRTYYTYAELFAPAGYAYNSESTAMGQNAQALTPCT
jgi:hypothetical protein